MHISRIIQFMTTDVWRIREKDLSRPKSFLLRQIRTFILSLRGVIEGKCQIRASALTFYTLLSVVPVVAMIFGITKGFGFEATLEKELLEKLEGQEEVVTLIMDFAHSLLANVKGGIIAGIGIILLLWAIISLLSNIENSFNDIWGIKRSRNFGRKIIDYFALMLICPILFIVSSTMTVIIASQVEHAVNEISLLGAVSPAITFGLKLLPYCVIWILFTFMYMFMPNTRVSFRSGVLAGVIAGTIYQLFQWGYINFQIGVAKYNAIYGGFAALPLFLIWLQVSWMIVLFGAEICFAHQNVETYEFERDCRQMSHSYKKLLALKIVHFLIEHFSDGDRPRTESQISRTLEIPIRCVRQILNEMVESKVVTEIRSKEDRSVSYQPARNTDAMTIKYVVDALEQNGTDEIPVAQSQELKKISECLKDFGEIIEKSPANMLLKDI